jgi:ADP-ribose pyrophosphatase YjhB (NUDIX family)
MNPNSPAWRPSWHHEKGARKDSLDENLLLLVQVAVVRDRKVLLVREEHEPFHGRWVVPGGYPKQNERLEDAGAREVKEELGLNILPCGLLGVYEDFIEVSGHQAHVVAIAFCAKPADDGEPRPSPEVVDWAWVDPTKGVGASLEVTKRLLRDLSERIRREGSSVCGGRTDGSFC